jgi:predicted amidohydrolase
MLDTVIVGGRVVDGTGNARFPSDVGIRDGKIVAIGKRARAAAAIAPHDSYLDPGRYPTGIEYVFVNGELAVEKGKQTEARAGMVLRA